MTKNEKDILIFAFRYVLNRGTAAPSIVIAEIMRRIDEVDQFFVEQLISDTVNALRHDLCDKCVKNDLACFLDKLLLHRDGRQNIKGFEFRESKMYIENKRIFRIEAYANTSGNGYLYMAKELDKDMKFCVVEVSSQIGRDPIMVCDNVMDDVRKHIGRAS